MEWERATTKKEVKYNYHQEQILSTSFLDTMDIKTYPGNATSVCMVQVQAMSFLELDHRIFNCLKL